MTERILGPTDSRRRRRFLLVPILLVALAAVFMIGGAQANPPQNSGLFELDKNAQEQCEHDVPGLVGWEHHRDRDLVHGLSGVNAIPSPPRSRSRSTPSR